MKMIQVRTPLDFGPTIGGAYDKSVWVSPSPEIEPQIRHALDEIFGEDLLVMSQDEPDVLSSFLEGLSEPFDVLRTHGLQVCAVVRDVVLRTGTASIPMSGTRYIIATDPCYFTLEVDDARVHKLGTVCQESIQTIIDGVDLPSKRWASRDLVDQYYERSANWCPVCMTS